MSTKALAWALDQEVFPPSNKFVLVALADFCGDTGKCYPGIKSIVALTGHKEETVSKALDKLVSDGVIIDTGKVTGKTGKVKVYELPAVAWQKHPQTGVLTASNTPLIPPQTENWPPPHLIVAPPVRELGKGKGERRRKRSTTNRLLTNDR